MSTPGKIMKSTLTTRRGANVALLTFFGAVALGAASPALAQARDPGAEAFVQTKAQKVIATLANKSLSDAQKKQIFHQAIDELADVPKITNFVLGKYARTITPDQRARFTPVFRAYAENVYQSRIDDYHGEQLKVTGSVVRKPGDVIVNSTVGGGQLSQPVAVSWRVLGGGQNWKVVDVQFKGIWLAITQQQDFVSTIDNAGGNIDVLINQLQKGGQASSARR
ncbi:MULTISPECIES: ABC transporter substrate-binding protein [Caulobacter]|jgi:phospholipid transport system substrate-binding protein|uniref:ABC-type transport system involved in resistance to organic solvent, auxiliary component n=1 Tax=Caulobacter vibrioides OR37 TaxID=1292034 RepID=R0EBF4_CAUVI|nr:MULTISPECIES: ABC transporter substrate-binding protein [Caulobacter]ENZ82793.1 ABC-type transport system involved in resistance to organic solvent, auxiliary component [Caulobacter vibrioides OR37]MBQ1559543.1 ABC transporter substrate-binding protein [Caulobacter sp.]